MLPKEVLLDVLKCMRRKGLAKIQDTAQLINNIIKRDFASKPLHIFDDTAYLTIRRNENNELLVGFLRETTDSTNAKCFVPSIQGLQDCDTEGECGHCYPIDEMRPFLANYIRYTEVNIEIDNVDNGLPPYTPEQITVLESISHIWTGQMLRIYDYFDNSIDYNLKGMLGSSAILQCHSLKLWKCPDEDETMSGIITDLQQCSYLYTIPVIYFSCPILENDILRLIHYKAAYPQSDTTLVMYDGYISELNDDWLHWMLGALDTIKENNRTKEVLQLKQITTQEAEEKFDVFLEEKPDEEDEDFQDDAENDSLPEVTDRKALILERFTA
ncbi:hypothetical protein Ddc_15235 [Ditylenchus destructor]|nr:hypothetical protein Ddc_15235 [Ditylenchus destructor]